MARGSTAQLPKHIYWIHTTSIWGWLANPNEIHHNFQGPYASRPTLMLRKAGPDARLVTYTLDENNNYIPDEQQD